MERGARRREQLTAALEVGAVVSVAPVGGAPARGDELRFAQPAEVVRDEVLRCSDRGRQLADPPVAPGQLREQAPAERVSNELERVGQGAKTTSSVIDVLR
jgi:hypothetical protein